MSGETKKTFPLRVIMKFPDGDDVSITLNADGSLDGDPEQLLKALEAYERKPFDVNPGQEMFNMWLLLRLLKQDKSQA